jgi:4-hydroxy-tetrahydrodipicolinate reductase
MHIGLVGYGKMGKEVERVALEKGWSVDVKADIMLPPPLPEARRIVDVVIHFAGAGTITEDLRPWAEAKKNIVVGTTGWSVQMPNIEALVQENGIGLIYASNFSLGVHLFYRILRTAGALFDKAADYDVFVQEIHHKDKADSPSGTALSIADMLLRTIGRKKEILTETSHAKIRPEQLHVGSSRAGSVVGTHTVTFDSAADSIELKHTAKNRTGLALGSLLAAEWIKGKHGLFTIENMMEDIFQ